MSNQTWKEVGKYLKLLRGNMTQQSFVMKYNIPYSRESISKYENGTRKFTKECLKYYELIFKNADEVNCLKLILSQSEGKLDE